jgi:nucleoside-diphosphate-sugar epimerase
MFASAYNTLFNVAVARYFFIYGPGQKSSMLIPRLVSKVQRGEEIVVEGSDGVQVSPIYVDDAAQATHVAGLTEFGGVVNIAGDEVLSIAEIAELIGEILSLRPKIVRSGEPGRRNLAGDNSKMRDLLCKPKTSLRDGLAKLIESDLTR